MLAVGDAVDVGGRSGAFREKLRRWSREPDAELRLRF